MTVHILFGKINKLLSIETYSYAGQVFEAQLNALAHVCCCWALAAVAYQSSQ
jgi:hypothetical protein